MRYFKRFLRNLIYLTAAIAISAAASDSYVAYFRAINVDHVHIVRDLLERGFDPNAPNERGQVGLYLALRDGAPRVAELLLAQPQIRIDATTPANETPLMMAALKGNLEWTQKLLARGAALNREGWTPLHYGASGPSTEVVRLLLERGAQVDAAAPNGNTALMMAAAYGAQDSAELLLLRGANASLRNAAGQTAADLAEREGREKLAAKLRAAQR